MSAVVIKNKMIELYMERKQYKKAYDLASINKESYQKAALIGFAHASEKVGKFIQAEEYFRKAAERYQSSSAPSELAIFYLRQKNTKTAIDVLREYERYNHFSFYFTKLIEYYLKEGKPEAPIEIVTKVKNGKPGPWVIWNLANRYAEKEKYEIAAALFKPLISQKIQPYNFAAWYVDMALKAKHGKQEEIVAELIPLLEDDPRKLEYFGLTLISEGYYDAAFTVFQELDRIREHRRDVALLMMAISWRGGSKTPENKAATAEKVDSYPMSKMNNTLIHYLFGDMDRNAVLSAIQDESTACEAHYIIGLVESLEGDKEKAIKHLMMSLETKANNNIEYAIC